MQVDELYYLSYLTYYITRILPEGQNNEGFPHEQRSPPQISKCHPRLGRQPK